MLKRSLSAAVVMATLSLWPLPSAAQTCDPVTRHNLARCAVAASLAVRASHEVEAAARGREQSARTVLPSNPVIALGAGRRASDDGRRVALGWSASISQEIEIGGQRSARRRAASAELGAQKSRTRLSEREAAAEAWVHYFDALAAGKLVEIEKRAARVATAVGAAGGALAEQGLGSGVDADVAAAQALRARQSLLAAERRLRAARSALASALGFDPARPIRVSGALEPLAGVEAQAERVLAAGDSARPELELLDAERRAHRARAQAYRAARVPNLTLSLVAERDGFDERYFGAGLALPLPLPGSLGPSYAGEIAEAEALGRRTALDAARVRRDQRLALVTALGEYRSRREEAKSFEPDRLDRANRTLDDIAGEIEARRLPVRDALVSQQALFDLLRAEVEASRELCLSSVALGKAAGSSFERGAR